MSKQFVKSTAQLTKDGRNKIIMKLIHYFSAKELENDHDLFRHIYSMNSEQINLWINIIGGNELTNKSGKIAKRIRRNCQKELGAKLPPKLISELGNIASNNSKPAGSFYLEIDHDLMSLEHGVFDDDGSCFYLEYGSGNNYHHRVAMDNNSEFDVIKVYTSDNRPVARCFSYSPDDENMILFNAYGMSRIKIATLLAQVRNNAPVKQVKFISDVWINGDIGSAIGPADQLSYEVWIDPDDYHDSDHFEHYCDHCETGLDIEWDDYHTADGYDGLWCDSCFYDLFTFCHYCEQDYMSNHITFYEVIGEQHIDQVCENCASDDFTECHFCEIYHTLDLLTEIDDIYSCNDCYEDHTVDCRVCDQTVYTDESHDQVCDDCYVEIRRNFAAISAQCWQCANHPLLLCADHYSAKLHTLNTGAILAQYELPL